MQKLDERTSLQQSATFLVGGTSLGLVLGIALGAVFNDISMGAILGVAVGAGLGGSAFALQDEK